MTSPPHRNEFNEIVDGKKLKYAIQMVSKKKLTNEKKANGQV